MQQNNLFKTREEKYQSRIRVLETLAAGTGDENEVWLTFLVDCSYIFYLC